MNRISLSLLAVIAAFGALSAVALLQHGYIGLFEMQLQNSGGMQVLTDLIIVCVLAMCWMVADARKTGRTVWPYLVMTLLLGSFGPLFYLLIGAWNQRAAGATQYA